MTDIPTSPPPRTTSYVVAVVVMALFGVVAILVVQLYSPDKDNSTLLAMIIGFLATMTTSLLALMKAQETHLSVNSRLDQFMKTAKEASHAEGILEGQSMTMVARTQGPAELPAAKPGEPPNIGFKITSIFMRR